MYVLSSTSHCSGSCTAAVILAVSTITKLTVHVHPTFGYNFSYRQGHPLLSMHADLILILNFQFLQVCRLCKPCRTERESFELKRAFLEHVSRRNFHRLLPDSKHRDQLSSRNDVIRIWFTGKCQLDASWCV